MQRRRWLRTASDLKFALADVLSQFQKETGHRHPRARALWWRRPAALALYDYLHTPAAKAVLQKYGFSR